MQRWITIVGFGILLYARFFYKDKAGNFRDKLNNNALHLPKKDLVKATKVAVNMALAGETNAMH